MKIHPLASIVFGLVLCSIGLNILLLSSNQKLVYRIQKLEAGSARGLFLEPNTPKQMSDEELNELINKMLEEMMNEQKRKNIT